MELKALHSGNLPGILTVLETICCEKAKHKAELEREKLKSEKADKRGKL